MGESITQDDILSEIISYLKQPDYHAEGWRQTREIADASGIPVSLAYKRLKDSGLYDMIKDRSNRAWWRKKV
jgi:hypothetical protein